jgi:putative methionine-R-sulfoxide reductase with GAF domain
VLIVNPQRGDRPGGPAFDNHAGEKLRRLQTLNDTTLSGLHVDDMFAELLERTRELLEVDTAAILLIDEEGKDLVATAATGLEEEVRAGVRIPIGEGFAGRVAEGAQPVTIDHVDHDTVINQILIDKQLKAMAGVPMLAPSRVIGVLHVGSLTSREFTEDDIELLHLIADRASLAAQARLSELDRAAALALQRSLLPTRPPTVDGLDIAARYIPGAQVGVGGDWYDLFPLPSGHVGIVIGDVAGNGLRAAVVMGRIRSALRAYALESNDPADVLTRLDRKIQVFEIDTMATAIYAVIDPSRTAMTLSVAGHLPPVLVGTTGTAKTLDLSTDLPLGAYPDAPRHTTTVGLPPGSTLLLYTDGLVERRDRPLPDGIRLLLNDAIPGSAEDLCSRVTTRLLPGEGPTDDVAVLAIHRADQPRTGNGKATRSRKRGHNELVAT